MTDAKLQAEVVRLRAEVDELHQVNGDRLLTIGSLRAQLADTQKRIAELQAELHESRAAWVAQMQHRRDNLAIAVKALDGSTNALDSLWAAIGDALLSGPLGLSKAYAQSIASDVGHAREAARAALARIRGDDTRATRADIDAAVAEAVQAEREACAKVAAMYFDEHNKSAKLNQWHDGAADTADMIERDIRARGGKA